MKLRLGKGFTLDELKEAAWVFRVFGCGGLGFGVSGFGVSVLGSLARVYFGWWKMWVKALWSGRSESSI